MNLQPIWLKLSKAISNRKEVLKMGEEFNFVGRWSCSTQLYHRCTSRYPQILKIHMSSYHYFSLLSQTVPQITVIVLFFFFPVLKSFKGGFIKGRRERQRVTLKKINFLWKATWKSVSCTVRFTLILFIALPPHFSSTINVILMCSVLPQKPHHKSRLYEAAQVWLLTFKMCWVIKKDIQAGRQHAQHFAHSNTIVWVKLLLIWIIFISFFLRQ